MPEPDPDPKEWMEGDKEKSPAAEEKPVAAAEPAAERHEYYEPTKLTNRIMNAVAHASLSAFPFMEPVWRKCGFPYGFEYLVRLPVVVF